MYCPNCGSDNKEGAQFCFNCGKPLTTLSTSNNVSSPPSVPNHYPPSIPSSPMGYGTPPYYTPNNDGWNENSSKAGILNIWRPFAGYGTKRTHKGWLMDNKAEKVPDLITSVREKFNSRKIQDAFVEEKELISRGLLVEKRIYFLLRRRLITVGLYINNFGNDLYLSIVSFMKPAISNLKVLIIVLMILFGIFASIFLPSIAANSISNSVSSIVYGGGPSLSGILTLLCIIGPLGVVNNLLLGIFLIYSIYKWFTEKDFLAGLRSKPTEFNEDDLMSMEKAVEQTVRMAMDEIGLDPDDLKQVSSQDEKRLI